MMLGIGPCEARNGAMTGAGIDKLIGEAAASQGTPTRSLEDFRAILGMLDSFPMDEQLDMIRLFFAWTGNPDDMAFTLRQRYLEPGERLFVAVGAAHLPGEAGVLRLLERRGFEIERLPFAP